MNTQAYTSILSRLNRLLSRPASSPHTPLAADTFNRLALELFALQFEHVLPYRRLCQHLGRLPGGLDHWSDIPAVPTNAFREFDLTCWAPSERTVLFRSSGTTGSTCSRHHHAPPSIALYEHSLLAWFIHCLLPEHGPIRVLSLVPSAESAPHSSLAHMLTTIVRELGAPASACVGNVTSSGDWTIDAQSFLRLARQAHTDDAALLLAGTAFGWVELLDTLNEPCPPLPAGSRLLETGGYKGRSGALPKADLHRRLSTTFSIPAHHIFSEYGMCELSSQAYDRVVDGPTSRSFRFPPWCRARVISPETGREVATGETGLIQVLDLANVYSVQAILTQDLGIRREDGFELAGRAAMAEGRGCSLMQA